MSYKSSIKKWMIKKGICTTNQLNNIRIKEIPTGQFTKAFKCDSKEKAIPSLFIKSKKKTVTDNDTFNEYNTLNHLWMNGYNASNKYCIAKPYGYIQENEILITKYISAKKLSNMIALRSSVLILSFFNNVNTKNTISEVSNWLIDYEKKIFQNDYVKLDIVLTELYEVICNDLIYLKNEDKKKLIKEIKTRSRNFDLIPVHLVNTDFKIHNILIDTNRITVIDWEKMKNNYYGFWMASALCRSIENLSVKWHISTNNLKKIKEIFLQNYLSRTIFIKYIELFPIIYAFESIIYLAESKQPFNNQQKRRQNITNQRLFKVLGIN